MTSGFLWKDLPTERKISIWMVTPKDFTPKHKIRYNETWTHFRGGELNFEISIASFPFPQIFKICIEVGNSMSVQILNRKNLIL